MFKITYKNKDYQLIENPGIDGCTGTAKMIYSAQAVEIGKENDRTADVNFYWDNVDQHLINLGFRLTNVDPDRAYQKIDHKIKQI